MSNRAKGVVAAIALVAFLWLAAGVATGRAMAFDAALRAASHSLANPYLTAAMRGVTELGSQRVIIGISALLSTGLWYRGLRSEAGRVAIAMFGAEVWMYALKALFHRPRPDPFFGFARPESYSFPSGHALLSACLYGLIAELAGARLRGPARWTVRLAMTSLILAIGFSRIYLGVHYPTDVIAGYLAAALWMIGVAELTKK